ncbi:MAG: helix-turn-helix domain-containing protein [Lentisphaeria bacterium]|nr:helix-turn-helix domain-containing protein [Lentisphaeria bacterium]
MNSPRINRVLQVLNLVALNPAPTRLSAIGAALGLHPSTVSRIIADLAASGLLVKCAYRSVVAAPELALLGLRAGQNHPLTRIARELLPPFLAEMELAGDLAAAPANGLYHFYVERRGLPAPEPLRRSDLGAVIFAAEGLTREQALERLRRATPGAEADGDRENFLRRMEEAARERHLVNFHAGRFWQLTLPLQCGPFFCAFSVARTEQPRDEKLLLACSRMVGRIKAAYNTRIEESC